MTKKMENQDSTVIANETDLGNGSLSENESQSDGDGEKGLHDSLIGNNQLRELNSQVLTNNMPYTIMKKSEMTFMTVILTMIGLCSSISMPIYWTALTEIQDDFHITAEQANMTVTAYLIFQAIAPVFISSAGDYFGRRPLVLICLVGGVAANVGLAVSNTYWLIILLRCILATFVAPTISLNSGITGDFTTRRNRGGILGYVSGFTLIGQGLAPFLGSVFDSRWNWRAIFWFSAAFDGFVLFMAFVFLPETRRTIVGNLSVPPKSILNKAPILLHYYKRLLDKEGRSLEPKSETRFNPFKPFMLLRELEITLILLPCSLFFATWTMSQVSLTTSLSRDYHYSSLKVGLCFFAPGISTIIGTIVSGKSLNWIYKRNKNAYIKKLGEMKNPQNAPPFNIIRARLCLSVVPTSLMAACCITYGWCLEYKEPVAVILVLSFLLTFGVMYTLNVAPTLLVDLHPRQSGGSTSLNNLFRCGMSAIFVSCVSKMNQSMSLGGTYTLMGAFCIFGIIILQMVMVYSKNLMERKRLRDLAYK